MKRHNVTQAALRSVGISYGYEFDTLALLSSDRVRERLAALGRGDLGFSKAKPIIAPRMSNETRNRIRELIAAGVAIADIADEVGLPKYRIHSVKNEDKRRGRR